MDATTGTTAEAANSTTVSRCGVDFRKHIVAILRVREKDKKNRVNSCTGCLHFLGIAFSGPGNNNYSEHDDRIERKVTDVKRRVSFKPFSGGRNKGGVKITDMQIRAHLEDDEAMGGGAGGGSDGFDGDRRGFKKGFRGRRRGSPVPRTGQQVFRKKLIAGPTSWYEVKIPYGHKYEKEFILRSLVNAISPLIFIPQYWKVEDTAVSFYIEDFQAAEALQKIDRTIGLPDGRKMIVIVRNSNPQYQVNAQLKERMKLAMVKRYNPATRALNLEKFHTDPDLSDIFCALFRPQIMLAAFDVIKDNIPDLEALNLNDNKLLILDHFRTLAQKVPNLKILHMANNKVSEIRFILRDLVIFLMLVSRSISIGRPLILHFQ